MIRKLSSLLTTAFLVAPLFCGLLSCTSTAKEEQAPPLTLEVTATAYNSVENQTKEGSPVLAAWGDELEPGMKAIAVSRDLIEKGLEYNTPVKIEGLPGTYRVMDKMNKRWSNRIDIYMGDNVAQATEFGKQTVEISWASN